MALIDAELSPTSPRARSATAEETKTKFRKLRVVGQGAYGRVFLVQHTDGSKYILKEIPLARLQRPAGSGSRDPASDALNEVSVLSRLTHPNITRMYGAKRTDDALHIIMEWADGGCAPARSARARDAAAARLPVCASRRRSLGRRHPHEGRRDARRPPEPL